MVHHCTIMQYCREVIAVNQDKLGLMGERIVYVCARDMLYLRFEFYID